MEHTTEHGYDVLIGDSGAPVKMWTRGVPVDDGARRQLLKAAQMPFIFKHVAVMPDVHVGIGATVGSVIPTKNAIIPAAVGCLLYTSPSPRDATLSRMPSSA